MNEITWTLASLGQLAILLEASSPKPGNVNRLFRFSDTGYRHFLASASMIARGLHIAATQGIALAEGKIKPAEVGLGKVILECSRDVFAGINKRNTILGTILLQVPLVVGIASTVKKDSFFSTEGVRTWITSILDATTVNDTLNLYRAFHVAGPGGDMNKQVQSWTKIHDRYDIDNPQVYDNIREDGIILRDLFRTSSPVDMIAKEWSYYFRLTLHEVYPYLDNLTDSLENLEEGIVWTFIWLLSKQPDGLIIKKAGLKKAEQVTSMAQKIMSQKPEDSKTKELLEKLDTELRKDGNLLNPGTTADLVSAAILCKLSEICFQKNKQT